MTIDLRTTRHLSSAQLRELETMIVATAIWDGLWPLSEDSRLDLSARTPIPGIAHYLAYHGESLVGYAIRREATPRVAVPTVELFVAPDYRLRSFGTEMLTAIVSGSLVSIAFWAHGNVPSAQSLRRKYCMVPTRKIAVLARSLPYEHSTQTVDGNHFSQEYAIRAFSLESDIDRWVALNRRVFAGHPEQGAWTRRDFQKRLSSDWFHKSGLQIVTDPHDEPIGFGWSKIDTLATATGCGEFYVLGVDRRYQGRGFGQLLASRSLQYLAGMGMKRAELYADESNEPAIRIYDALGYRHERYDIVYLWCPHE